MAQRLKESTCNAECKRHGFDFWVKKIPRVRAPQHTPVFWPRESLYGLEEPGVAMRTRVAKSWMQLSTHAHDRMLTSSGFQPENFYIILLIYVYVLPLKTGYIWKESPSSAVEMYLFCFIQNKFVRSKDYASPIWEIIHYILKLK